MQKIKNRYRYSIILLKQLVKTDFKLRYQGSVLGYLWSLLRPLLIFLILYIVFAKFLHLGKGVPNYPIYLLLGIVLWSYFVEVTTGSVSSIVTNGDLIGKINFPKYVIVLATSFAALINLFINFIVIGILMVINGVDVHRTIIYLPIIIVELYVFSLAVAFFLSTAFVWFRDMGYIWEVVLQAGFYATPIIYPLSLIPNRAAKLLLLNPLAQMIQDARYMVVTKQTQTIGSLYGRRLIYAVPLVVVVIMIVLAAVYFRSRSKYFAEEV